MGLQDSALHDEHLPENVSITQHHDDEASSKRLSLVVRLEIADELKHSRPAPY